MRTITYKITLALLVAAFGASAQDLSKEVLVDRDVVPAHREATRPSWLLPEFELPSSTPPELFAATYTELSPISRSYSAMPSIGLGYGTDRTPYRGYLALGYFPTLDFGLAVGYRAIDREDITLNIRGQFSDEKYFPREDERQFFVTASAGADFSWWINKASELKAFGEYDFLREASYLWHPQNVNTGRIGAEWSSKAGSFAYYLGAKAAFETNSHTNYRPGFRPNGIALHELGGLSQNIFDLKAGLDYAFNGLSKAGLDFDASMVHTGSTLGVYGITPYYIYKASTFTARVGVRLDIAEKFSVMPSVRLALTPLKTLGIWVDFGGGSENNTFAMLRQECVYQVFNYAFNRSKIPFKVEGGINFGPFTGVSFGVFGGYAIADNWLMASHWTYGPFSSVDVKGWHAGIKAEGKWSFIKASVSADFAPSSYNRAWYLNRDRAASVVKASVEANPIKPLTVGLGYDFRGHRRCYSPYFNTEFSSLGCISNLSLGAEWAFNQRFAAFVRLENLLCRKYEIIPQQSSRRLGGLVGISLKF